MILITEGPRRKSRGGAGSGIMAEDEPFWRRMDRRKKCEGSEKKRKEKTKTKTNKQTNFFFKVVFLGAVQKEETGQEGNPDQGGNLQAQGRKTSLSLVSLYKTTYFTLILR